MQSFESVEVFAPTVSVVGTAEGLFVGFVEALFVFATASIEAFGTVGIAPPGRDSTSFVAG